MIRVTRSLLVSGRGWRGPVGCSLRPRGRAAGRSGGGATMVTSTRVIVVPCLDQDRGQQAAARPGGRTGNVRHLPGLAGQLPGTV